MHITIQVVLSNGQVLIPPLIMSLNQTECMCQSVEVLAASVVDTPAPTTCQRTSACDGVMCELMVPIIGTVDLEVNFQVCQDPPRIDVVVTDSSGSVIFDQNFDSSDMVDISLNIFVTLNLDIFIENHNYSIIIQVNK